MQVGFSKTWLHVDSKKITTFKKGYIKRGIQIYFSQPKKVSKINPFIDNNYHLIQLHEIKNDIKKHTACFLAYISRPINPSSETIIFTVDNWKNVLIDPNPREFTRWLALNKIEVT